MNHPFYVYTYGTQPNLISTFPDRERAVSYTNKLAAADGNRYIVVSLISNAVVHDTMGLKP